MREYPDNHRKLVDGDDDLELAPALRAVFEVDVENALEQAHPAHARRRAVEMGGHVRVGFEDSVMDFDQSKRAGSNTLASSNTHLV